MIVAGGVTRPLAWTRAGWIAAMTLLVTLLGYQLWLLASSPWLYEYWGFDYRTYMGAARDWLSTGTFYEPYQLAGPYVVRATEVLYPPVVLVVLVPFTVIPAVLWWIVPLGITAAVVGYWRPSAWGWVAILACLTLPFPSGMSSAQEAIFNGNPVMWAMAAVALGTRWPVFAPWALLKPTVALPMLVTVRSRAWWIGLGIFALACLAFLPMWPDYVMALRNASFAATLGPFYTLVHLPLVAIPVVAYLSRRAGAPARSATVPWWPRRSAPASES